MKAIRHGLTIIALSLLTLSPSQAPGRHQAQATPDVFPYQVSGYIPIAVPEAYQVVINRESHAVKIPSDILARVLHAESGWNPICTGINRNGTIDSGLAQLNSRYLDEFAWRYNGGELVDPYDPEISIRIAARHLARLHQVLPDWRDAVAAYNCGLTRFRAGNLPETTQKYLERIFE